MEVYEIVAIFIGIAITSFAVISISSIFYCIYISCQGCIKPATAADLCAAPALDGTVNTDQSICNSNQMPETVIGQRNQNI